MKLAAKTALIFDLDGTLIDSVPWHERAYLRALGKRRSSFRYARYLGMPTREVFARLGFAPAQAETLARRKRQAYLRHLESGKVPLFAGAAELLDCARARGLRCYLVTGASRAAARLALRRHGLARRFRGVVAAEDVSEGKPSPAPLLHLLRSRRLDGRRALVVEDSANGRLAARRAGLDVVLVHQARHAPSRGRFRDLTALREWLERGLEGR